MLLKSKQGNQNNIKSKTSGEALSNIDEEDEQY
jgi:hypothetical protein